MATYGNPAAWRNPYADVGEAWGQGLTNVAGAIVRNMKSQEELERLDVMNRATRAAAGFNETRTAAMMEREARRREAEGRLRQDPTSPEARTLDIANATTGNTNAAQFVTAQTGVTALDNQRRVEADPTIAPSVARSVAAAAGKPLVKEGGGALYDQFGGPVVSPSASLFPVTATPVGQSQIASNEALARERDAKAYTETTERRDALRQRAKADEALAKLRDRKDPNLRSGGTGGGGGNKSMTDAQRAKFEADDSGTLDARRMWKAMTPEERTRMRADSPKDYYRAMKSLVLPENKQLADEEGLDMVAIEADTRTQVAWRRAVKTAKQQISSGWGNKRPDTKARLIKEGWTPDQAQALIDEADDKGEWEGTRAKGATAQPKPAASFAGSPAVSPAQTAPKAVPPEKHQALIDEANRAVKAGKDPAAVRKRLEEMGVKLK